MRFRAAFFCLVVLVQLTYAVKLNYPRVLLPIFDKLSINFTLEVIEGGCFKWSSSRPDLITITPIYDDAEELECSSKAILTTLFREKRRSTSFVLAQDLSTSEVLRCDVILDVIDKLDVLTTTRELYLEEAPETFELWAQDSQGNAFTTLEGVEFNWKISSQNPVEGKERDWQRVLRFLRFSESKYHDVPPTVEKFDRVGLRGYMVLLEGINTGSAKVSVELPYPEYAQTVEPLEVNIVVLANIILDPSDVHILVGDSIAFRILQLKQGKLEDITSNTQYYLEVGNSDLATLEGNVATGHVLGRTAVVLKDRNVANNLEKADSFPSIQASLTICRADKITLNLLPYYNWLTVKGERHTIGIDLYTNDNQLITLGDEYNIESQFDENIFHVAARTANGSNIFGEAINIGKSSVLGSFETLKATAELQVFDKLELHPSVVFLPYDPNHSRRQKIQYKANGGDGLYVWSSLNANLIGITQNGVAETKTGNQAISDHGRSDKNLVDYAQVKVALQRNTKISKIADIFFLPPTKLEIVRYNFETTLKDYVYLHVALYAEHEGQLVPLTSCDNLQFDYDMSEEIFHRVDNAHLPAEEQLHPSACHIVALQSHGLGSSHFKISYTIFDRVLRAEVNLLVFEKLDILNPFSNEIVLPIGASRNVIYQNGPQKVFNIDAELVKRISIDDSISTVTEVTSSHAPEKHILNVLCRKVGSSLMKFEVYNTLAAPNFEPYVSKFETYVHCVKPRFINLYTTEKMRAGCPLKVKNSLMHVKQNDNLIDITIEVLDAQNRKLQNLTSLLLSWQFVHSDNNQQRYDVFHERKTEEDIVAGVNVPKRDFLATSFPDVQSSFKIKASVDGYDQTVLYSKSIYAEQPEFGIVQSGKGDDDRLYKPIIENELDFLAVNSTLLPFESISIFLAPGHEERVQLIQGSGFYDIKLNDPNILTARIDNDLRQIIIEPIRIGQVEIDIWDRCLQTDPSRLTVSVVSIGRIELQVADRVEKSKTIEAIARIYDSLDNPLALDYDNLKIYELRERIWNPNILSIETGHSVNLNVGEIEFFITGSELGETKLTVTSGSGEEIISSPAYPVQVFPPLRLLPRNSTIVIGSSIQIECHGGPHPDANVVYSVEEENVVSMDLSVVTGQRLGKTIVVGRSVGVNPSNPQQQIVYSEDRIEVNVVPLSKVKIVTPLRRVRSGTILPASIWGVPNISPLILGTLTSKVRWHTNQPDVIEINGIFSEAGVEYDEYDSISVRLKALNPGTARIQAEFSSSTGSHSCFIEIVVFKLLELELPRRVTSDTIIVPPRSQINLKANLPDARFFLAEENTGGLKVSSEGVVRTTDHIGRDLIIAKSDDQILTIPIETKNIHYVMATLHSPSFKLKQLETKIPSGMNVILKVTLHDNLGNTFSHGIQDTSILASRLAAQEGIGINFGNNFTVSLNLPRQTSNLLSISLKNSVGVKYNEDFVKLSVSKSTGKFPSKKIFSVGDIICFDSPLVSVDDWTTSDDSVLRIDGKTGIGIVRSCHQSAKFGDQVIVTNGDEQHGYIKYDLEVREADTIEFYRINDIFNGRSFKANLIIKNHLQVDKLSNLIAKNATTCLASLDTFREKFFTCTARVLDVKQKNAEKILDLLNIVPIFDKQFGSYACEIDLKPKTSLSDMINLVQSDEFQFELVATLANGISTATIVKTMPAISVYPIELSLEQIEQQSITVTGIERILQKVQVTSSDPTAFEITATNSKNSNQYKVKLLRNVPTDETAFLIVNSPSSTQTIQIPIRSLHSTQRCLNQPFQSFSTIAFNVISNLGLIVSMLIILAATIWALIYCFSSSSVRVEDATLFQKTPRKDIIRKLSPSRVPTPRQPFYPDQSFGSNTSQTSNILHSSASPIYGDSTLISPNKRMNRRYL